MRNFSRSEADEFDNKVTFNNNWKPVKENDWKHQFGWCHIFQ